MKELTPRQAEILQLIRDTIEARRNKGATPPCKSPQSARRMLLSGVSR
jgi:LexA DNA binding domain